MARSASAYPARKFLVMRSPENLQSVLLIGCVHIFHPLRLTSAVSAPLHSARSRRPSFASCPSLYRCHPSNRFNAFTPGDSSHIGRSALFVPCFPGPSIPPRLRLPTLAPESLTHQAQKKTQFGAPPKDRRFALPLSTRLHPTSMLFLQDTLYQLMKTFTLDPPAPLSQSPDLASHN